MDNLHLDVEQGPAEHTLAYQMRLRSQSIRVVVRHTLLLTMVPFGAMLILSAYFQLISLDKVINALLVTYVLTAVLLLYAYLIWFDYTDDTIDWDNWNCVSCGWLTFLFYFALDMTAFWPFCPFSTFPHYQPIAILLGFAIALIPMSLMCILFHIVVMLAQDMFGGRSHPFEFGDDGFRVLQLSQLFAFFITCMYMCELANVGIANAVIEHYAI